ncbi:hypothetical protein AU184_03780 [Mycolicibacterium novocastrense]|nr:hypothetical protein AU183_18110 [Mycolicibacterium novocastrense]KUH71729.1 hypothetical protein AU072_11065 [Mycolicibacterium novocastrense]KUH72050.1 hypothetical protein AU184_03780 [Mycolicibacterium novocastrense]
MADRPTRPTGSQPSSAMTVAAIAGTPMARQPRWKPQPFSVSHSADNLGIPATDTIERSLDQFVGG